MAMNTTNTLTPRAKAFYNKVLLETSRPQMAYSNFGRKEMMKENSGKQINFARYENLPEATTPLNEAITPPGRALLRHEVVADLEQYGDYVTISDVVSLVNLDPELSVAAQKLGEQQGLTINAILRDALSQGTNEVFANSAANRAAVADKVQKLDFQKIARSLQSNNAKPVTHKIDPSTGIATQPVPAAYIAIGHTDMILDLMAMEESGGFVPVHKYASSKGVFEGEVGTHSGIRFILTSTAPVFRGAGTTPSSGVLGTGGSTDVYLTYIFGEDAYAEVALNKMSSGIIVKAKGKDDNFDSSDPLNQRNTVGWKALWAGLILDDTRLVRYEHGVTA